MRKRKGQNRVSMLWQGLASALRVAAPQQCHWIDVPVA
jgi:hypothetical protein